MKSTLSISYTTNAGNYSNETRTIEVPCRLPDSFNFVSASKQYTAVLKGSGAGLSIEQVDWTGAEPEEAAFDKASAAAESILATIKAALGITGHVPPGSPLPAIALAYEAECAAYKAAVKAHRSLPNALHSPALLPSHPSERNFCSAVVMLANYVEYVVEQACKAQTDAAKVEP